MRRRYQHLCEKIPRILVFMLLGVCLTQAGPSWAANLTPAQVTELRNLADSGNALAAFRLASHLTATAPDGHYDAEAVEWFTKAANQGLAEAQYNLGVMYARGRGVDENRVQAANWYRRAADQGLAAAQFNLGTAYGLGIGVPKDETLAVRWLQQAAAQGVPQAQYNLAVFYRHGRGVRKSEIVAREWFQRAADGGYKPAMARIAALNEEKDSARPVATNSASASPESANPESENGSVKIATAALPDKPAAQSVSAVAVTPAVSAQAGSGSDDYVSQLNLRFFTLQILSVQKEDAAKNFLAKHFPSGGAGYFKAVKKGVTWYSVVAGEHPSMEAAQAAVADLPTALAKVKPWIRKVAAVRATIAN